MNQKPVKLSQYKQTPQQIKERMKQDLMQARQLKAYQIPEKKG